MGWCWACFLKVFLLPLGWACMMSACLSVDVLAQGERARFAPDAEVRKAFTPVIREVRLSVVEIDADGSLCALGTVVDAEGGVLSKASELVHASELGVTLFDGRRFHAELVGVDRENDLAFLKVESPGLKPVRLVEEEPGLGRWLACVGRGASPHAVGVVSASARAIEAPQRVMGVILDEGHSKGLYVRAVSRGLGADRAGIQPGDVLLRVAGKKAITVKEVVSRLQHLALGDKVSVELLRGDEHQTLWVGLSELKPDPRSRSERMDRMGGEISGRRRGFERVLQHDAEIRPEHCGGPVVNLRGQVVGVNIARASRVASYALPSKLLNEKVKAFKDGLFPPKTLETANNADP